MKIVTKRKNTVVFGNVRFTFYSECSFKAEYAPGGDFINRELFVTDINGIGSVKPESAVTGNRIKIKTRELIIEYRSGRRGFCKDNLKVTYKLGKKTKNWHYGIKDTKNLGGAMLHLFKFPEYTKPESLSHGVLSRNGFFAYYDTTFTYRVKGYASRKLPEGWAEQVYRPGYRTMFFIGYGTDYKKGLKEYSKIFGRCPMVPGWALGFWYSRWHPYTQDEFLGLVKKYRGLNIPIDVMVIDTDWRKVFWRGYDLSKKHFPNLKDFIKKMKKLGVKTTFNDHPGYNDSEPVPKEDSHIKKLSGFLGKKIEGDWRCNWANPDDVRAFMEVLLKPKIKAGVDFWWVDGWGADGITRNERFFKKHEGEDGMSLGTVGYEKMDPQLWLNHFYYLSAEQVTRKRGLILSRWGGPGSHRYPVQFSGDTFSTWETLAYEVYFTYTGGNILANYWSHDLGGYLGEAISKELFIRWCQFGAFSPVMRTHSAAGNGVREPWKFGSVAVGIFRKYVRLRYRLQPYFYTHTFFSHRDAVPWIKGTYLNYPDKKESYDFKQQYLIGDDVLVAPVTESSHGRKNAVKDVFFPGSEWISPEDGAVYKADTVAKLRVPLGRIPFFVRKGAVIPVARDGKYIGEKDRSVLRFEMFGDSGGLFEYYEDDGVSNGYLKKEYATMKIKTSKKRGKTTVLLGAMRGAYKGMPKKRKLEVVIHLSGRELVTRAEAGGKKRVLFNEKLVFGELPSNFNSFKMTLPWFCSRPLKIDFFHEDKKMH